MFAMPSNSACRNTASSSGRGVVRIGGATRQPEIADPMAVNSIFRREQWLFARQFQNQRRAKRGDGISRLVGAGREKGRASVRCAGDNDSPGGHTKPYHRRGGHLADDGANRNDRGKLAKLDKIGCDPIRPGPDDRVISGLQGVAFVTDIESSGKSPGDPVRLMEDLCNALCPQQTRRSRQWRRYAVNRGVSRRSAFDRGDGRVIGAIVVKAARMADAAKPATRAA